MGENTNRCETEDPKTKKTIPYSDVEEERKNKNTTIRLGPALTDFIKRYRQEHPECTSDSAAADCLFLDTAVKYFAAGEDIEVRGWTDAFIENLEATKTSYLALVHSYRTLKENEENKHGGIREELQKELVEERKAKSKAEDAAEKYAVKITELEAKIAEINADRKQQNEIIDALSKREDPEPLRQRLDAVNSELSQIKLSLTDAEKDRDFFKKETDRLSPENAILSEKNSDLTNRYANLNAKFDQIKDELAEVKGNLKMSEKGLESANKELEKATVENDSLSSQLTSEQKEKKELEKRIAELTAELAATKEQVKTARAEGREEGRREESEKRLLQVK